MGVTAVAVGLDSELGVTGGLPLVEIVLLGDLPTLQGLSPNDVTATVNLTGLDAGEHVVPVSVSAPSNVLVVETTPESIKVTLEAR